MTDPDRTRARSVWTRKERRYKTSSERILRCQTIIDDELPDCAQTDHPGETLPESAGRDSRGRDSRGRDSLGNGTVVDLSTSGIRLLCHGQFKMGQKIRTELLTDRSHGIYRGVVRRVEPWVGGQSILGCSLEDPIADAVLQDLANDGVVNRRADGRIGLSHRARISWQLNSETTEVEIRDYSNGGMKIESPVDIPENASLRIELDRDGEAPLCVQSRLVWKHSWEKGCVAGIAFSHVDAPVQVAHALGIGQDGSCSRESRGSSVHWIRRTAVVAATLFALVGGLLLCGLELPWAMAWVR